MNPHPTKLQLMKYT